MKSFRLDTGKKKKEEEKAPCINCKKEIFISAGKCEYCGKKQIIWYITRSFFGLIIFFVTFYAISTLNSEGYEYKDANSQTETQGVVNKEVPKIELLELLSFRCYTEYGYFHITGEVKNISQTSLESILAVGTSYTEAGGFIKSSDALIEYDPILPNQISPFTIMMSKNPAMSRCKINFKEFWGEEILTKRSYR